MDPVLTCPPLATTCHFLAGIILLQGKRVCFVSNNSGKSRKEYMAKLNAQGIEAHEVSQNLPIFDHALQEAVTD